MVTKPRKEARPRRTKSKAVGEAAPESSARPGADSSLPAADMLALIAANVSKGIDLEPRLAVDYAFKLWQTAREKLEGEMKERAPAPADAGKIQKNDGASPAPAFPATFDVFLRQVVNGPSLADSTNRFRDFLRSNSASEVEADKRLARFAEEGFPTVESWQATALEYHHWSETPVSPSTGKPAETAGAPAPKTALPTFETFLRTVVKGETDAESENRFRAFLRSKFPESEAEEQMTRFSTEGFKDIGTWLKISREYRDWCRSEKPG